MSAVPWILGNLVSPTVCREKKAVIAMPVRIVVFMYFNFMSFQMTNILIIFHGQKCVKRFSNGSVIFCKTYKRKINLKTQSHKELYIGDGDI